METKQTSKDIREILIELGFSPTSDRGGWRARPIYRDSNNNTSLKIFNDGQWIDFSAGVKGRLEDLVKITLGLQDIGKAKEWLSNQDYRDDLIIKKDTTKLKTNKKFGEIELKEDGAYWEGRGIDPSVLKLFRGGVRESGKMKDRYVFPIFNYQEKIIGFAGRSLHPRHKIKWKILGNKINFVYPAFLNYKELKNKKEVILVESIGDVLALWNAGITNTLCCFGVEASFSIVNFLIRLDINKIIISLNNDVENNNVGNIAAQKTKSKLLKYFDNNQIFIHLPTKNDFGVMSKSEIIEWHQKLDSLRPE